MKSNETTKSRETVNEQRMELFRFLLVGIGAMVCFSFAAAFAVQLSSLRPFITSILVLTVFIPIVFVLHQRFTFRSKVKFRSSFLPYSALQIASFSAVSFLTTNFVSGVYLLDTAVYLTTALLSAIVGFVVSRMIFKSDKYGKRG